VADDSAVVRELLRRFMERWGYDVSLASDGSEAWDLLQYGDAPTIAILDWIMPGVEGIELCRRVRRLSDAEAGGVPPSTRLACLHSLF